jgi:dCMP deaminase
MHTETSKWHKRYIQLAKEVSTWSKDPSRKIGAVIVGEHGQIISQGFNGFPRGVFDFPYRYEDRPTKYQYVVHAEMNAIYNATLNGVKCHNAEMYVWGLPVCSECAKGVIQVGIKQVHIPQEAFGINAMWDESFKFTKSMFEECGVGVTIHKTPCQKVESMV